MQRSLSHYFSESFKTSFPTFVFPHNFFYQFVADEYEAGVLASGLARAALLGDEAEEPLLRLKYKNLKFPNFFFAVDVSPTLSSAQYEILCSGYRWRRFLVLGSWMVTPSTEMVSSTFGVLLSFCGDQNATFGKKTRVISQILSRKKKVSRTNIKSCK